MISKFKKVLLLTALCSVSTVSWGAYDLDSEEFNVVDEVSFDTKGYKNFNIDGLGCTDGALNCIVGLDYKRDKMASGANFLFDNLKFIGSEYSEDSKTLVHTYYLNKDYEGYLVEQVNQAILDSDEVIEGFYCQDPLVRLAMDDGLKLNYRLMIRRGDVVEDSGSTASDFDDESCSLFLKQTENSFYSDVLKVDSIESNKTKNNVSGVKSIFFEQI